MTPRRPAPVVPALRRRLLLTLWLVAAGVVVVRSVQLQVVDVERWREAAAAQHRATEAIVAPRGTIRDRDGVPLAVSRETFRVGIDPDALVDRAATVALLQEVLGLPARTALHVTDPSATWRVVPGRFEPAVRDALADVRGVHLQREVERFYPHGELARGILGAVLEGEGTGGIEQRFDEVLRGRPGRQVVARDGDGRPIPGAVREVEAPRAGGDVRLTLDLALQEIAHEALTDAVEETGARGGDVIVSDPHTGEILALVSMSADGSTSSLAAINTSYEPGSTFKPFTVAALLEHGRASLGDVLDAEEGRWIAPDGRPLTDVVPHDSLTLAEALRVSSNVAVAKAALRLQGSEQFEVLRDFGFGVETGIPLPGEVPGMLRHPEEWTERSPVALSIGYEASVTPLQMALAYGALANGGVLMEPRLVVEAGGLEGHTPGVGEPRALRQVVSPPVTRALGGVLVDVVEEGTGTAARLGTFRVAGKSGTSRVYVAGSGYARARHFASFVGYFPADDPQLVIFVKLDSPSGAYYGGATAAPVTRAAMEAVLAARRAPIDRRALLDVTRPPAEPAGPEASATVRFASLALGPHAAPVSPVPTADVLARRGPDAPAGAVVPDVRGLPARDAVRRLHDAGLRVRLEGVGAAADVVPGAGAVLAPGDTVVLRARPGARRPTPVVPVRSASAPPPPPPERAAPTSWGSRGGRE